jgi:hypothetical protein
MSEGKREDKIWCVRGKKERKTRIIIIIDDIMLG